MTDLVRCPACRLVLEVPAGASNFRCPCGIVLAAPHGGGAGHGAQAQLPAPERAEATVTGNDKLVAMQHAALGGMPPVYTEDSSRSDCELCPATFGLLNRRHHCRACGALVCGACSEMRWPANMLPPSFNSKGEKLLRVCKACHGAMETFRGACLHGDLATAQHEFATGRVRLSCPYSIYPSSLYPIHCAASSGSVPLVQWLLDRGCVATVRDGRGFTALAAAAQKGHVDLVRLLVQSNVACVDEITDRFALQLCLRKLLSPCASSRPGDAALVGELFPTATAEPLAPPSLIPPPHSNPSGALPPPPAYRPPAHNPGIASTSAPVPHDAAEEEAQLRIALAASKASCGLDEGLGGQETTPVATPVEAGGDSRQGDSGECIICFDAPVQTCFVPCGHSCICAKCAEHFQDNCPVCRSPAERVIRTYNISS